jgi:hypothetical protein
MKSKLPYFSFPLLFSMHKAKATFQFTINILFRNVLKSKKKTILKSKQKLGTHCFIWKEEKNKIMIYEEKVKKKISCSSNSFVTCILTIFFLMWSFWHMPHTCLRPCTWYLFYFLCFIYVSPAMCALLTIPSTIYHNWASLIRFNYHNLSIPFSSEINC